MMKWLKQSTNGLVATLLVIMTVFMGMLATPTVHTLELNNSGTAGANCLSSCASHGQLAAINNQKINKEDDDKEPTPPPSLWPQDFIRIELLYILPILLVVWVADKNKKILLTNQLRF